MIVYHDDWLPEERFEELVDEALDLIPAALWDAINNVAVLVEDWPSAAHLAGRKLPPNGLLLGLYQGIPLTARTSSYNLVPPDKIIIFRRPILRVCPPNEAAVRQQVHRTVLHEIAHHFGISDEQLHKLGAY